MHDVAVIEDPAAAIVALDPVRSRLLAALATPASAASLAGQLGLTRQKVTYHLAALVGHGLVHEVEQRRHGGLTERVHQADAAAYVVAPAALGAAAPDPDRAPDRLAARHLIALAARLVDEVGTLVRRARQQDRRVATLALDTEVRFRDAAARAAFADDLAEAVRRLVAAHHDERAPGGRRHRLVVAVHPVPPTEESP